MEISPIGAMTNRIVYTEHRVARQPGELEILTEEPEAQLTLAVVETATPSTTTRLPEIEASEANAAAPGGLLAVTDEPEARDEGLIIQPGDQVLISYNDEPERQYTLSLSKQSHDPDNFVINASKPLAQALMGYAEEDEVDIPVGGATRNVTILKIDRPGLTAALAT
jgi:hypothetical protein